MIITERQEKGRFLRKRGGWPYLNKQKPAWRRNKRCRFYPWVRKILWRRAWQPTLVVLPGESRGQRSLVGYNPQGPKESDMTEVT